MTFNGGTLSFSGTYTIERGSLFHLQNTISEFFWWGPSISLPQNDYMVICFLKFVLLPSDSDKKLLNLDVTTEAGKNILAKQDTYLSDLNYSLEESSTWQKITLSFSAEPPMENVGFRGMFPSSDYNVYLAFILVQEAS